MYSEPPAFLPEEQPSAPRKRKPGAGHNSPLYMPAWAVLLMLLSVFGAAGCAALLVLSLGGRAVPPAGQPEIVVLTAAPTVSPAGGPLAFVVSPTPWTAASALLDAVFQGPTLVPTNTATPTPAVIAVGRRVEVVNRSGARVRVSAGTDNSINRVLRVANFGQVFEVVGGPQQASGLTFWQVRDLTTGETGWMAEFDGQSQILRVVEQQRP
ncbi:MAG: hypothetical protein ACUVSX_06130 [Aggregatilineales bacterium]